MKKMRFKLRLLCRVNFLVLAAILFGCHQPEVLNPKVLRFGAIPDQSPTQVLQQHQELINRICATIKMTCVWVPVESYDAIVERVGRGELDVAYMGAVGLAQALHRQYAVPLVMRDIDFHFTSVIVVRKTSAIFGLDDLKQTSLRFGNRSSASSHFMLRQRLQENGIIPERYFRQVSYAQDHDGAIRAVAQGEVDAAGINASVFYKRLADGDPYAARLRTVWQSPPFNDYVWAARSKLPAELRQALVDAFLDLDINSTTDAAALGNQNAAGYLPAFPDDFEEITRVLRSQGAL